MLKLKLYLCSFKCLFFYITSMYMCKLITLNFDVNLTNIMFILFLKPIITYIEILFIMKYSIEHYAFDMYYNNNNNKMY